MNLIPGMTVIKINDNALQFGADDYAIRIEDLKPALIEIVLAASHQRGKFARYLARKYKVSMDDYETLLHQLKAKRLLVDNPPHSGLESCYLRLYGSSPLLGRNHQAVEISGLPLFAYFLIQSLQEYEFRYFKISDKSMISEQDTVLYPPLSVGEVKEKVFPSLLQSSLKAPGKLQQRRLAIGVFSYRYDLSWAGRQQRRSIPQLPIVIGENQIRVGPLMEPYITVCPRCIYLQEKEKAQIGEEDIDLSKLKAPLPAVPLQKMVAYFTGEQISNYFGQIPHLLRNRTAVFHFGVGIPTISSWKIHPDCGNHPSRFSEAKLRNEISTPGNEMTKTVAA